MNSWSQRAQKNSCDPSTPASCSCAKEQADSGVFQDLKNLQLFHIDGESQDIFITFSAFMWARTQSRDSSRTIACTVHT